MVRSRHKSSIASSGYTLVELLIVMLIAVVLIATVLPIAATVLDDARVREASRTLNSYFAMAKSRASSTGRPCGVWLVPEGITGSSPARYQVTQLYLAEVPAAYGGSTLPAATAYVEPSNGALAFSNTSEKTYLQALIEDGEAFLIRFDYKGDFFVGQRSGTDFILGASVLGTTQPPPSGSPKPFQITRLPKRIGSSLELPATTAVDLRYSGIGQSGTEFSAASTKLLILFQPGGAAQSFFIDNGAALKPTGTMHFLVGRIEKTGADPMADSNLADPTSLWVSVGAATGVVVTSENTPDSSDLGNVAKARSIASSREQMGGR
jgi:Tfp pilus assembly protein FimT